MKTLNPSQIARINRLELVRYRKTQSQKRSVVAPLAMLLVGIWVVVCFAVIMMEKKWNPGDQLWTALPANQDLQQPSITICGEPMDCE